MHLMIFFGIGVLIYLLFESYGWIVAAYAVCGADLFIFHMVYALRLEREFLLK